MTFQNTSKIQIPECLCLPPPLHPSLYHCPQVRLTLLSNLQPDLHLQWLGSGEAYLAGLYQGFKPFDMRWPASTRESWSKNLHHDLGTKVNKRIDVTSPRNPADKGKKEPRWFLWLSHSRAGKPPEACVTYRGLRPSGTCLWLCKSSHRTSFFSNSALYLSTATRYSGFTLPSHKLFMEIPPGYSLAGQSQTAK